MTTTASPIERVGTGRHSQGLHIALWIVQTVLGVMFAMGGLVKATMPIAVLAAKLGWPGVIPEELVRLIGIAELAGGLGLVLPAATRIRPGLTPLAALGLVTIMALAMLFHLARGEGQALPINLVLGGLAAFVAWGRLRSVPIPPRRA